MSTSDPVVASLAQDIFKELSQIEACQGPMQMRLIPTLVSIMQAPADKIPAGLCAVSGAGPRGCVRWGRGDPASATCTVRPAESKPGAPKLRGDLACLPPGQAHEEAESSARLLVVLFLSETRFALRRALAAVLRPHRKDPGWRAPRPAAEAVLSLFPSLFRQPLIS